MSEAHDPILEEYRIQDGVLQPLLASLHSRGKLLHSSHILHLTFACWSLTLNASVNPDPKTTSKRIAWP